MLTIAPTQALVGVRATENGREGTDFFAAGGADESASDLALEEALAAIGSRSDLDREETVAALDRIRHEGKPGK